MTQIVDDVLKFINVNEVDLKKLRSIFQFHLSNGTAGALAKMIEEPIISHIRRIQRLEVSDLESLIPVFDSDISQCGVFLKCKGDIKFDIFFVFSHTEAKDLAARLFGIKSVGKLSELNISALSEVGNIMGVSFLNSIGKISGFQMEASVPVFAIKNYKVLLEIPVFDLPRHSKLFVADAEIRGAQSGTTVYMYIMFDHNDAKNMVNSA